jgi:hypothetical protein
VAARKKFEADMQAAAARHADLARQYAGAAFFPGQTFRHFLNRVAPSQEVRADLDRALGPVQPQEVEVEGGGTWDVNYNMAKELQKEADVEYAARKNEVALRFKALVERNMPRLLQAIGEGQLIAPNPIGGFGGGDGNTEDRNILAFGDLDDDMWRGTYWQGVLFGGYDRGSSKPRCAINDTVATYRAMFRPETASALAILAGVEVKDLPDVLQHWTLNKPYVGNNILNRLDPVEGEIHNPWMKLRLNVVIHLSKRAYAKIKAGEYFAQAGLTGKLAL